MKNITNSFLFLMFLSLYSLNSHSLTIEELKKLKLPNNRVITVTGHPDYAPVIWKQKKGKDLIGISVELIKLAFAEINVKVKTINTGTWGRAQAEVGFGNIDMLLPPYLNEKRVKLYKYHKDPFMMDDTVIFVKKGAKVKFNELSDLKGHKGVALIHDSFGNEFDEYVSQLSIKRLTKTDHCFRFLLKGRSKYMVAGYNAGLAVAAKMNVLDQLEILPKRVIVTGMYLPISLKSKWNIQVIHNYLNTKIKEYKTNGIFKKLEDKYLKIYKEEDL